jgi:hypothetical protein
VGQFARLSHDPEPIATVHPDTQMQTGLGTQGNVSSPQTMVNCLKMILLSGESNREDANILAPVTAFRHVSGASAKKGRNEKADRQHSRRICVERLGDPLFGQDELSCRPDCLTG